MAIKKNSQPAGSEESAKVVGYELMVIIKPLLSEEVRKQVQEQIMKLVEKLGGKIRTTDVWGKRHLAYKIMGHNEGYYVIYRLDLVQSNTKEFEAQLKLNNNVLRHLLIQESNL